MLSHLNIQITQADANEAICGSPTKCTIAQALRRHLGDRATYIKVLANRITVTADGFYHHYAMPNLGLRVVALTDSGKLKIAKPIRLALELLGKPSPKVEHTMERQDQINVARHKRVVEGRRDKSYAPNPRRLAAMRAGMAMKKLEASS